MTRIPGAVSTPERRRDKRQPMAHNHRGPMAGRTVLVTGGTGGGTQRLVGVTAGG